MRAFVTVVEEGGLSAAARRLHISQPALSQTMNALERELGVRLLVRSSTGVRATEAGMTLLSEARAVLARYDRALSAVARHTAAGGGVLRLGIPLELPGDLLSAPLAELAGAYPATRVQVSHLSTAAQFEALRGGGIEVGLVRERPVGHDLDAVLVVEEHLGVLLAADQAARITGPDGIALDALAGYNWVGFPRSGSPAWYDELTAILRSHGLDLGPTAPEGQELIAEVKFAAVTGGGGFALAPADWSQNLPDTVVWSPLAGHPLVRRTWAVWPAGSHRRDLARFVLALDEQGPRRSAREDGGG
ncbi:LysR family transcriptional regulator [Streptomyces sulfonofaciens]|uniref:LysR family transcriptional regulator n=2 Tax=Streptomyces sulfonofaciens TaxID=68272 RepID=A0A919G227_9ACTN|nr:LysR family transcriptional regulator [Streptomyces sulfonofaciens]